MGHCFATRSQDRFAPRSTGIKEELARQIAIRCSKRTEAGRRADARRLVAFVRSRRWPRCEVLERLIMDENKGSRNTLCAKLRERTAARMGKTICVRRLPNAGVPAVAPGWWLREKNGEWKGSHDAGPRF